MDDRQFRETMERYARSTAKGREADFAKLNGAVRQTSARRFNLRLATALVSVVLIVAVSLAVALPLTLDRPRGDDTPGQGDGGENYFYCSDDAVVTAQVSSFDDLASDYGVTAMRPSIATVETGIFAAYSEEYDATIGTYIELAVFDEYFDTVYIKVVKYPYVLKGLMFYDDFTDGTVWRGHAVRCFEGTPDADGYRKNYIAFEADGYDYFVEFGSNVSLDSAEALEAIYG